MDAGSWFDAAFEGEPVPELGQALELLAGWKGRIYPELKGVGRMEEVDRVVADGGGPPSGKRP